MIQLLKYPQAYHLVLSPYWTRISFCISWQLYSALTQVIKCQFRTKQMCKRQVQGTDAILLLENCIFICLHRLFWRNSNYRFSLSTAQLTAYNFNEAVFYSTTHKRILSVFAIMQRKAQLIRDSRYFCRLILLRLYVSEQRRHWPACTTAQADLSLCFSHVFLYHLFMSRFIYIWCKFRVN